MGTSPFLGHGCSLVSYLLSIATYILLSMSGLYLPLAGIHGIPLYPPSLSRDVPHGIPLYPPSLSRDVPTRAYCILLPNGSPGRNRRVISPTTRNTESIGKCWETSQARFFRTVVHGTIRLCTRVYIGLPSWCSLLAFIIRLLNVE